MQTDHAGPCRLPPTPCETHFSWIPGGSDANFCLFPQHPLPSPATILCIMYYLLMYPSPPLTHKRLGTQTTHSALDCQLPDKIGGEASIKWVWSQTSLEKEKQERPLPWKELSKVPLAALKLMGALSKICPGFMVTRLDSAWQYSRAIRWHTTNMQERTQCHPLLSCVQSSGSPASHWWWRQTPNN